MTVFVPPQRQLITTAVLDMLRAELPGPVGDNRQPASFAENGVTFPYWILYDIEGGENQHADYSGNLTAQQLTWQLTCVGRRRDQAQAAADRAVRAWEARDTTTGEYAASVAAPPNCSVSSRLSNVPPGVLVEDSSNQAVFSVPLRVSLTCIPG